MPKKLKGKQSEKLFCTILEKVYKKSVFIQRLKDTTDATGRAKKLVIVDAQPADFIVTLQGVTAYVEVKESKARTAFPFGNIAISQKIAAKRQVAAHGKYLFVIHRLDQGHWYCVPAQRILGVTSRKSLPWKDLRSCKLNKLEDIKRYF